ncbi:hypothetical protein BC833DRAFT_275095 [Globomyces pollinis-pini]|nr:hypothetical protein BC833DRAFT_275095 [Globomyces pollinis-pini]
MKMYNRIVKKNHEDKETIRKRNHSQIERRRREKMSECFNRLKELVPINHQQGTTNLQKLEILNNTILYIENIQYQLQHQSISLSEPRESSSESSIGVTPSFETQSTAQLSIQLNSKDSDLDTIMGSEKQDSGIPPKNNPHLLT